MRIESVLHTLPSNVFRKPFLPSTDCETTACSLYSWSKCFKDEILWAATRNRWEEYLFLRATALRALTSLMTDSYSIHCLSLLFPLLMSFNLFPHPAVTSIFAFQPFFLLRVLVRYLLHNPIIIRWLSHYRLLLSWPSENVIRQNNFV